MCLLERILSYNNLFMREFTNKAAKLAHKGAYSHDSIDGNFNRINLKINVVREVVREVYF